MTRTENIRYVAFLSFIAALGGFLFGYDTAVISGTVIQVTALFGLSEMQSGWYVGCALLGSILGVSAAGALSDRFGRRPTMMLAAVLFFISAVGCAVAPNLDILVVSRIIGGVGIGVVSIVCPIYISEISVAAYRGRMVSLYQLAVTVGFLGAYVANYFLLDAAATFRSDNALLQQIFHSEVWRAMLGAEALPAFLFLVVIFLIPESPRWLIVRSREAEAAKTLNSIYRNEEAVHFQMQETRAMIQGEVKSDWRSLLEPWILRAVLIGSAIAILGQFMGVNAVLYYGPSIFENSGLSSGDSLFYQALIGVVNVLTTVLALLIIDRVGRKKLVYFGVSGMILTLVLIGFYFFAGEAIGLSSVFLLVCFLSYIFFCAVSISAVIFVFLSEMYPTRVRGMAMSVAGLSLWVGTFLIGQLTPWLLSQLTPAGTFWLFAAMCVPYMLIVWKLMPETAGKSLEDIERFWMKKKN